MDIGTDATGDDRPVVPLPDPNAEGAPLCIVNLVGVGGTLPDVTLCMFWLSPIAAGKRGNVIGNLPME